MVARPLSIFGVSAAGCRWWMKMLPGVVHVRMPIPPTLPRAVLLGFSIVNIEVVVAIPADLQVSRPVSRVLNCYQIR